LPNNTSEAAIGAYGGNINEMLRENTTFIAPPKLPLSQKQGQRMQLTKNSRVNEILASSNRNNTIPLSETSNMRVETVDSESVEDMGTYGQSKVKSRLRISRK
jgi:hypothetical protein